MQLSLRATLDRIGLKRYSSWLLRTIFILVGLGFFMGNVSIMVGYAIFFSPIYFLITWWRKQLSFRGFLDGIVIFAFVGCLGIIYDCIRLRSIDETEIATVNEAQAYFQTHGRYPNETKAQHSSIWSASIEYFCSPRAKDGSSAMVLGIYLYPFGRTYYSLASGTVSGPRYLD